MLRQIPAPELSCSRHATRLLAGVCRAPGGLSTGCPLLAGFMRDCARQSALAVAAILANQRSVRSCWVQSLSYPTFSERNKTGRTPLRPGESAIILQEDTTDR